MEALQQLLIKLATDFINVPLEKVDEAINEMLKNIGIFTKADRAYIFNHDYSHRITSNTHEWCANGITPQIHNLQATPFELFSVIMETHNKGEIVYIPSVAEMPENHGMRQIFEQQDIKSLILLPLVDKGVSIGFVGFVAVREIKRFAETEINLLKVLAELITNVMLRRNSEKILRESEEQYRALIENTPDIIMRFDQNGRYLLVSPSVQKVVDIDPSQFIGKNHRELGFHEDLCILWESAIDTVLKSGKMLEKEYECQGRNGLMTFNWRLVPEFDEAGHVKTLLSISRDITESKQAEAALMEAARRRRNLMNITRDGIVILNQSHRVIEANQSFAEMLGYSAEEVLDLHIWDWETVMTPEHIRTAFSDLSKVNEIFETRHRRKDGVIIDVEVSATGVHVEGQNVSIAVCRDITSRKEAEEALRKSEEKLSGILNNITDVVWSLSWPDLNLYYISPSVEKLFGRSVQEFIEKPSLWQDVIHFDDQYLIEKTFAQLQKEGTAERECRIVRPDGSIVWIYDKSNLIFDENHVPIRVEGIAYDITDRKQVEEAVRESEERYKTIIAVSNTGAWEYNRDTGYLWCSTEYYTMIGYEPSDFMSSNIQQIWIELIHPDDRGPAVKWFNDFLGNNSVGTYENHFRMRHKEGKWIWIWSRGQTLHNPDGTLSNLTVGTHIDITDSKQAEQQLADYTLELEQLYHQLDEELDKARKVHERILPKALPAVSGLSFTAHYQPAQKLGGDFYDVIQKDNKLIFYLSDVSGHGLDGAMLSVFVKHTIKGFLAFSPPSSISPANILHYLAKQFAQESYPDEYFICIFMAVLDLESMELTYSGAGFQDTPLVRQGNGEITKLVSKGLFITSYLPHNIMKFYEESLLLTPGTTIFLNTDGLTEQEAEGAYYMDRLPNVFYEIAHLSPQLVTQVVTEDFRNFNNGSLQGKDDITFLVLQVDPVEKKIHHLELTSDFGGIKSLQEAVSEILPGFQEADLYVTCLFELAANAIEHGNRFDPEKTVFVEITIVDGCIQTIVQDQGNGFSWREKIERPLDLDGREERGRGIAMTRICCDQLFYNEKGNRVTFTVTTREGSN